MATQVLAVPEQHLEEVIKIIRAGLESKKNVTKAVRDNLEYWCHEEGEYLKRLNDDST